MPVWYILTLGIYRRVWLYQVTKEIDGHAALGTNHRLNLFLLILPIIGPSIVTFRLTRHCNQDLHSGIEMQYGPTWGLWAGTLVPIIGPASHMVWTQDRLNRYWQYERDNPEHAVDLDQGLSKDAQFVARLKKAKEASVQASSRFDVKKRERRERWADRTRSLREARQERALVRAAGGSTPVLPWRRPKRPAHRLLHISCGRCEHEFDVHQDPFAETPILCAKCGLHEVIPSPRGDFLAEPQPTVMAAMQVDCPDCKTRFHALRDIYGPTKVTCFSCGHTETVAAPKAAVVKASS